MTPAPAQLVGGLLVLWAVQHRVRSKPSTSREPLGALVLVLARLCWWAGLLARPDDLARVCTRVAAAPRSLVARLIAAAARADVSRQERRHGVATVPPALDRLMPGVRCLSSLALAPPAAVVLLPLGSAAAVLAAAAVAVLGARLPDLVLARAARRATRAAVRGSAATVDLLAALGAVGLPLQQSLERAARRSPAPLAAVLRAVHLRNAAGEGPAAALAAEAARHGLPALAEVAGAVDRSRRLGAPLPEELRRIAARLRVEERAHIAERSARRGPLATLVVALVIAPLCVASLVACLLGGLLQGGSPILH